MKQTARRAMAQNAKVVERCLAHCFHMINTDTVPIYAELCYALQDEIRVIVTAVQRPNMSTAALERRLAKRTLGRGRI